ncbi:MAG: hypothetical protein WC989_00580 [Micavibrio sp.]
MKKIAVTLAACSAISLILTLILTLAPGEAMAQGAERQVYPATPSGTNSILREETMRDVREDILSGDIAGSGRIYPGREAYGRGFGPIPRHPGDYRDAVDRGQWTGGGSVGARSFSID